MKSYQDEAKKLLNFVGGKENVASVTHCATRLRFALVDEAKADSKGIQALSAVKGTFTNAGQFQVIIGNDVANFYKDFIGVSGIETASKEDVKKAAMSKQPILQRMVAHLAEIFVPLIPALVAGGLMLGLGNFLGAPLKALGEKSLVEAVPYMASLSKFIVWIGVAVFGMLPVLVTWSTVKKFKGNEALGIVLGLMLVLTGFMLNAYVYGNIVSAGENIRDILINGSDKYGIKPGEYVLDLGFYKILMIGYQAQVLPAMFAGIALCYIQKFIDKRTPEVLKTVWVPFATLVITGFLTILFIGPVARYLGDLLVKIFTVLFQTPGLKYLGALLFGTTYAPLVITGLHHTFIAVDLQLAASGGTFIWPLIALSNIAQSGAVFATYFIYKKDKKQESVSLSATVSAWFGITEPALFGANLKYMYPFYAALIGSAVGALISTGFNVIASGIGVGGLALAFLSIKSEYMIAFWIASIVAFGLAFFLTILFSKTKLNKGSVTQE
ncbi:PTS trehalose transporter subunit IIBC [Leptotrichia sp. OH3620_COT-345]|uniref:PTS trehalose transporter subunit IIBC n=1 Tax=Leptotrichia sp. OH3620_COT-345 TaxID=2491048 RepID=UPI000F64ED58|nr:PTS trehalose transporter subunit IIBC [Leptotrichia sp. OH3620_COT-345]RRD40459.1 PTS trehalose transporter subunit IIBC [Leptotrichia sp. OH3620_COT-345]